ncbi:hypothetical protein [Natrinema caseinilyticum]|uniref:hypothetical protein n=1 Tax=Natrinema caseinilyticum TaxID=2961570 RepID=UPI0020C29D5F|nr:hypothetical protein [Natrinema caseinilyticum]
MDQFHILHYGNNPHESVSSIARIVIGNTQRSVTEVRITGILPLLSEHVDSEAVDTLIETGINTEEDTIQGTVQATSAVCEAVFSLFSDSLLSAEFVDESGNPVFIRQDNNADFIYLHPREYERIANELPTDLLARIYPREEDIPITRLPDGTNPAAGTSLTEYKLSKAASDSATPQWWDLIDLLDRDINRFQFCGLVPVLRRIDKEALAALQSDDTNTNERLVIGSLVATEENLHAVRTLWGDGIHYLYCEDIEEKPLFLRESPRYDFLYLTSDEYATLENSNPGTLQHSHRW